jgi:Rrf2 family transcriptional regulator, cysteine metabolism repressor
VIFSSKAEYGVRLMVELGRQTADQPISLKAIADAEGLPLAYLEQVVARLRKADLVRSARGAHGGYWLARDAAEITMHDVVGALEGAIAPMECFVHDEMERIVCSHIGRESHGGCATKLLWTRVQAGIVQSLRNTTLADLVEFSLRNEPAALRSDLTLVPDPVSNVRELRVAIVPAADADGDPDPAPAAA